MVKLYTVSKTRPRADCGSDHELLIAKFRLKLKKVGKTTRPFKYDLNQIPYDYTPEMTNRFKGLDLVDRGPEELWTEVRFGPRSQASLQKAQGPGVCKVPKPPGSRALCQAKRAPRAALPSGCLAAPTKRWAEGIRVPAPLAGRGSTTARGILRLCPASACQTGLPWSSPPA